MARFSALISALVFIVCLDAVQAEDKDIRLLTQHFNEPGADLAPWTFLPSDNVAESNTSEHPGLAMIREAGRGTDVKGLLKDPIRIDEYPLPWQFQLGLMQAFDAQAGVGSRTQINYAMGLNVAVTFSDPATWPSDRSQRPPDTHDVHLLVVHLGTTGEAGNGLPQYSPDQYPETYMLFGRGDLDHRVRGDWRVPYVWIGDGAKYAGPSSPVLNFRAVIASPTQLAIGIRFEAAHGWNMRHIDCSRFGKITGIWEIGPIFSCDRWIPDVLCANLPLLKGAYPIFASRIGPDEFKEDWVQIGTPEPQPPNPAYEYYVDYCTFDRATWGSHSIPFEHYSEDFDIPGYLGQYQIQPQGTLADTYSHPGHLAFTVIGTGSGTGFCPGATALDLATYEPPWEIEIAFVPPETRVPWNLFMNFQVTGPDGKSKGAWLPGVENFPKQDEIRPYWREGLLFKPAFACALPKPAAGKPLSMLIQVLDRSHVRTGFRVDPQADWLLSETIDCQREIGGDLGKLGQHCFSTVTGRRWGAQPGTPTYQQFLIDYIHYRYGLTAGR